KLPPGRRRQPVHSGVADGGARRGVGRGHDALGIGETLQEAFYISGQLPVLRPLAFAFPDGATEARGQFLQLEGGDGAHLPVGRAGGQPDGRSTKTRSMARRISASYGEAAGASKVALLKRSMTSSRPGSVGSRACCATMRAARSSCRVKPMVTSAATVAGL